MRAHLLAIMQSLKELHDDGEALIYNDDLKAVRAVLDSVGYVYLVKTSNHSYTRITLRY